MNFSLQDRPCSNQMADSRFPTAVISHFYSAVYLLRKFSTIEVCVKLETKIRKTISTLTQIGEKDLIYNAEIHQHQKARRTRKRDGHYTILNNVEKALKELIAKKLAKTSPD